MSGTNKPIQDDPNNPSPFQPKPQPEPAVRVLTAVAAHSGKLQVPSGLDSAILMVAIALNESSLGVNVGPRRESSYDKDGEIWKASIQQQALVHQYGSPAACSYGPWQMMFINFSGGIPPDHLSDFDLCAQEFVRHFNSYVMRIRKATNLSEVGQVWNGGHIFKTVPPGVQAYVDKLKENYDHAAAYLS